MIYEYKCNDCNKVIEVECKMKDYKSKVKCPYCNKTIERNYDNMNVVCNTYFNGSYNNSK